MPLQYYDSPLGTLLIKADSGFLKELLLVSGKALPEEPDRLTALAVRQLAEYFNGSRTAFDLPVGPEGTAFQKAVWAELMKLPFGRTVTYGGLAGRLGKPKAARAVGGAVGRNPILIIIPCHRVLAERGLGGFSAGTDKKIALLRHEGIL